MKLVLISSFVLIASTLSAANPGVSSMKAPNLLSTAVGSVHTPLETKKIARVSGINKRTSPLSAEGARKLTAKR